jgi:tetratricopeptide (TPR) repeat protein
LDQIVGTGVIVLLDGTVATCMHVVRDALSPEQMRIDALVGVRYPGATPQSHETIRARVVLYFEDSDDDVVLLSPVSAAVQITPDQVALLGPPELDGVPRRFVSFGYRRLEDYLAARAEGVILGDVPPPIRGTFRKDPLQLRAEGGTVNRGMSGSAVLDVESNLVVGLISEIWNPADSVRDRDTGWAVDARLLSLAPFGLPLRDDPLPKLAAPVPEVSGVNLPAPQPRTLKAAWNQAPALTDAWVGRDEELRALLADWRSEAIRITSLVGLAGSGKSALARRGVELLLREQDRRPCDGVFWWSFGDGASADEMLEALLTFISEGRVDAAVLTSATVRAQVIGSMLRNGRFLIVLDGLEALQHAGGDDHGAVVSPALRELLTYLASSVHSSHTIVTTRFDLIDLVHYTTHVRREVGPLPISDGIELLRQSGVSADDGSLRQIVEQWTGHPLALTLTARLMAPPERLDASGEHVLPSTDLSSTDDRNIADILGRYDALLDSSERYVMMALSSLRSAVHAAFIERLFRQAMQDPVMPEFAPEDALSVDTMLSRLRALRLCQITEREFFVVHPLAKAYYVEVLKRNTELWKVINWRTALVFLGTYLGRDEPFGSKEDIIRSIVNEETLDPDVTATETISDLEPLIEAVHHASLAEEFNVSWMLFRVRLQRFSVRYLWTRLGAYDTALDVLASLYPDGDLTRSPRVDEDWVPNVLNTTALTLLGLGRVAEAIALLERAFAYPDTATGRAIVLSNLAGVYAGIGELRRALATVDGAIAALEGEPGDDDGQWRDAWFDLKSERALLLGSMGDLPSATREFDALIDRAREDEPYRIVTLGLARHALRVGDLDRAEAIVSLMIEMFTGLSRASSVADAERLLGDILLARGDHETARAHFEKSVAAASRSGKVECRIDALAAHGRAEARWGDAGTAEVSLEAALELARKSGLRLAEVDVLVGIGWLRLGQGRTTEASSLASIANDRSAEMNHYWGSLDALALSARLAELHGALPREGTSLPTQPV